MKCKTVNPNQMPRNVWKARIETHCRFIPESLMMLVVLVTIPGMVLMTMMGMVLMMKH